MSAESAITGTDVMRVLVAILVLPGDFTSCLPIKFPVCATKYIIAFADDNVFYHSES
jgi:hypothetical protein